MLIPDLQEMVRFIDEIGTYDPNQDPSVFKFDEEKAKQWLANGAKPTETVGKAVKAGWNRVIFLTSEDV